MRYSERPLAIVDLETTGLDASIHEILDMAVLIVDQKTLKITDRYSSRIKPRHIKRAARRALEVVGYSPRLWQTAVGLETALHIINEKAKGAILCSTNIYLARSFLDAAFKRCGVEDSTSYHHPRLTLDALCAYHGIASQPLPRRAREGARTQLAILQALRA
jgi:DNA polymerase-3 subunit epsilon